MKFFRRHDTKGQVFEIVAEQGNSIIVNYPMGKKFLPYLATVQVLWGKKDGEIVTKEQLDKEEEELKALRARSGSPRLIQLLWNRLHPLSYGGGIEEEQGEIDVDKLISLIIGTTKLSGIFIDTGDVTKPRCSSMMFGGNSGARYVSRVLHDRLDYGMSMLGGLQQPHRSASTGALGARSRYKAIRRDRLAYG